MKRLLTAALAVPLALAAVFQLAPLLFFLLLVAIFEIAVFEFVRLSAVWAPRAPRAALLVLVPGVAWLFGPGTHAGGATEVPAEYLLALGLVLSVGVGLVVLLGRTPIEEAVPALAIVGFGLAYFSVPLACLYHLQRVDPWLLLLLLAIVWLGDTAAYYCGTLWGRRKLAPVVSPNKTWVGAAGAIAAALAAAAVWSQLRLGGVGWPLLALAAVTSAGAQLGDLVESTFKRAGKVKDSGVLLPGHGGMLDRLDALFFGAPVLVVGLWLSGLDEVLK